MNHIHYISYSQSNLFQRYIKKSLYLILSHEMVKNPPANARRHRRCRFNPWVGKIPEGGNGHTLQCTFLGNSMDRGAWQAIAHGIAKSQTQLNEHKLWVCTCPRVGLFHLCCQIYVESFWCLCIPCFLPNLDYSWLLSFCKKWILYFQSPVDSIVVKVKWKSELLSHVQLFLTLWTVAHQAPLSI